ncbi:AbrB family transcriptional regulator [Psychrobacillus psychrodurans]|uniref:AbrB family transcriptional regulator n=1 Tax=Psychrobacillus psychrodurans TaxID=126157 RepID=A0A9X3L812_9BACI|nr:AbrB family transcriptional regulator [Psychrobacillus psychrodurans]MCZ8533078.1 AbrB family transcriptional regulator [Psychrobacillus psychrodurans]
MDVGTINGCFTLEAIFKRDLYWPISFKSGGQMLLGYSMGLSFTIASARQILEQLPSMAIVTILMVVFGLVIAYFVSKSTGINITSAVMGTTSGGLSQMVVLSEEIKGADPTVVIFMQTIRMLTVIFIVPTLSLHAFSSSGTQTVNSTIKLITQTEHGSFFQILTVFGIVLFITACAVRFKCPTPWILGPLVSSAILTVSGFETLHLPPILVVLVQLCLGIYLGLGIRMNMLSNWKKLLPFSFIAGLLIVGFALVLAYCLHMIYPISMTTAFLYIAPGGLPEMGITAHTVHADVSMVAAYQLFRVFFILFIVPIFLRYLFGRHDVLGESVKES